MHRKIPAGAITVIAMLITVHSVADELNADERAVWGLEEKYYEFAEANDPESYLELFDDDIIGWPTQDPRPKGRDKVSRWIGIVHSNPAELWRAEIEREAIHDFGDVVVVHYRLRDYFVTADTGEVIREDRYKITHTWMRRGDSWKIISGMGGRLE